MKIKTIKNRLLNKLLTLNTLAKAKDSSFIIKLLELINKKLPYRKHLKILLTDQHIDRMKNLLDYYKGEIA